MGQNFVKSALPAESAGVAATQTVVTTASPGAIATKRHVETLACQQGAHPIEHVQS